MYKTKDPKVVRILQKAREFADSDLLNEALLTQLINADFKVISTAEKEEIITLLNSFINAKDKVNLSG
ncbi:hypothetical protein OQH60_01425 [Campylobacter sp. MIT 21-1685]|uniref:hypothetical protein n=1 Tax=unclassified Campylobacter TaxID=2593542 RepID=UPI00224A4AD8|nr:MULTISPECIES: hypothetical protein [unclassified Campylobacter]MCX2682537.1 hypothetical protein [Campylobacter sp. MIT 21-1684]MCX2750750.1 hypothetical protein [Campylobacter sp. MIT 21-1682]MCX2807018.1 hypothetical protein [Campylobacter sp. MIT 21-1685]